MAEPVTVEEYIDWRTGRLIARQSPEADVVTVETDRCRVTSFEGNVKAAMAAAESAERQLREDAVFAAGYRAGYYEGGPCEVTPFQSEVDDAHARWVAGGRKTHLDKSGG